MNNLFTRSTAVFFKSFFFSRKMSQVTHHKSHTKQLRTLLRFYTNSGGGTLKIERKETGWLLRKKLIDIEVEGGRVFN